MARYQSLAILWAISWSQAQLKRGYRCGLRRFIELDTELRDGPVPNIPATSYHRSVARPQANLRHNYHIERNGPHHGVTLVVYDQGRRGLHSY